MGLANRDPPDSQHPGGDRGERALDTLDRGALDRALSLLWGRKARWALLPIVDKIRYLEEVRGLVRRHADAWGGGRGGVEVSAAGLAAGRLEGVDRRTVSDGGLVDRVIRTLEAIRTGHDVLDGVAVRTIPTGPRAASGRRSGHADGR